ncbi:MAG: leucine--tRNA ligase [Rhodothermales bacterium]|nr:leucine--tRNA ligase [Rhodothermales bacterium]
MSGYTHAEIEARWQKVWEEEKTFATPDTIDFDTPKFYVLDMFPYPSGVGLHVGHPLGYIATDIVARYKRMLGFNVLHPIGFDAFGLPAEQFAVEHGVHPRVTTEANINNMLSQLKRLGFSYDWDRVLATTDTGYYKWTQWIFLQLYNAYFDEVEGKARSIETLRNDLSAGARFIDSEGTVTFKPTPSSIRWPERTVDQQEEILSHVRLAYLAEVPVNWCPGLGTVLANEEVTADGRSERGNYPVFKRPLKQWMLRITTYSERLLDGLDDVEWPAPVKMMQENWIGKSTGARVRFPVVGFDAEIDVFTTRPDTLFGATYMVLAPEHPLVDSLATKDQREAVDGYRREASRKSDVDRASETREKTGVFTGGFAVNPTNGLEIPIWISDYVLMGYGTGAIMAVPAHDSRDFEFAQEFGLEIRPVIVPPMDWLREKQTTPEKYLEDVAAPGEAYSGSGIAVNSFNDDVVLDGLSTTEAKNKIIEWLEDTGSGKAHVQYKLRDWLFSRQRYWGEPFPILHGPDGSIRTVPEADLPVALPPMEDFRPEASDDPDAPPRPPLSRAPRSWREIEIDGVVYKRELNTMPQWAGSCWYYLRFIDPGNEDALVSPEKESYWMGTDGVDLYVGGVEHAVLHLLYARFWQKVLFDLDFVSCDEPFGRLVNQGYIQAYAYRDQRGIAVEADSVVDQDGRPASDVQDQKDRSYFYDGAPVTQEYGKMGKSLKNAVSPDEICEEFGCDTLRLYEMYLGPLEQSKPWNTRDIVGVNRFLKRVWRNYVNDDGSTRELTATESDETLKMLHGTIKRVTDDLDRMSFNTAIAALIEMNSFLMKRDTISRPTAETFLILLSPLAPHIAEELWNRFGNTTMISSQSWPSYDEKILKEDSITIPVQVNGKVRASISIEPSASKDDVLSVAREHESILKYTRDNSIVKEIYVPGKIVNLVVK